jgi:hypothetical protein
MSQGKPDEAHGWLCAHSPNNRLNLFPLFPVEVADDPQLIRIAAAVGDRELAERVLARAERRRTLNPEVRTIAGVAAHSRGIWYQSVDERQNAATLLASGPDL